VTDRVQRVAETRLANDVQESHTLLTRMESAKREFQAEIDSLYASLELPPELEALGNVDRKFLHLLIQCREAKTVIRHKALGTLFEMDRLEQAVGGANSPLGESRMYIGTVIAHKGVGTKLHQRTLKSIQKRRPAIEKLIRRYNEFCATLKSMYRTEYQIPLPQPLSDNLYQVRDDSYLLEDVIVSQMPDPPSRWFTDPKVRLGARAALKLERCDEETDRLLVEATNMSHWWQKELTAVELALLDPGSGLLALPD
jgi:hypothetical protein